jgi:hypothetical protein
MDAYGSDRVRVGDDGTIVLSSRLPKPGWVARVEKTLTSARFPGTAVCWDDVYYEVVAAEGLAGGGARYTLAPWEDQHAMRVVDRYDAASEAQRVEEARQAVARERGRRGANVFGIFTGHLPAAVQSELGRELGILPAKLTMLSAIPCYLFIISVVLLFVQREMESAPMSLALGLSAGYLMLETNIRFFVAYTQSRPMGSAIGLFLYLIYYALAPNRARLVSPFHVERGHATPIGEAPEDVALRDAFILREPLVTLLSPEEQGRAAERFGYQYRRQSVIVAAVILVFSLLGLASSFAKGALLSGLLALALAVEQIIRLAAFARGPAPSILGWLVRPLVRRLLA